MKSPKKIEQLLDELLAGSASAEGNQSLLRQMLQQRGRARRQRQMAAVGAVVLLLVLWLSFPRRPAAIRTGQTPICQLILTQPLPSGTLINTQTGLVAMVTATPSSVAFVTTHSTDGLVQQLNDEQLLALLKDRSAALVRYGPHEAELILPGQSTDESFQVW